MSSNRGKSTDTGPDPYEGVGASGGLSSLSFVLGDPAMLGRAADVITGRGHALVLARTSDGGAFSIRILAGGVVHKFYPAGSSELEELLSQLGG